MFAKLARIFSVVLLLAVAISAQATTYTTWTATPAADVVTTSEGLASTTLQEVATSAEGITAMAYRTDVLIYNQAGSSVYVNVGSTTVSASTGILIPAAGSLAIEADDDVPIGVISAATSTVAIVQTVNP